MLKHFLTLLTLTLFLRGCPNESNCMECEPGTPDHKAQCKQCFQGYINDDFNCITRLAAPVDHCTRYQYKSFGKLKTPVCETCENGYFVVNDKCRKCQVAGCAICETEASCSGCANGRALDLEKEPVCLEKACEIRHCDLCVYGKDKKASCLKCAPGNVLIRGNSQECLKSHIQNCAEITHVEDEICKVCADGYFIDKYLKCVKNAGPESGNIHWFVWFLLLVVLSGFGVFFYEKHFGSIKQEQEGALLN